MSLPLGDLRARLHEIIFEADTPEGRLFDLLLLVAILSSVAVVLLDSVAAVRAPSNISSGSRACASRCAMPGARSA